MARLRCEVLERDGPVPVVVRDESGRVLRLHIDAPPAGAHWLGHIDGIGVWATPMADSVTTEALEVVWLDTPALDEVGVVVGPDRGDALGLFDSPTSASTGEHTEGAPSGPDHVGEQRRTSVLAWIAAQEAHTHAPIDAYALGDPHAQGEPPPEGSPVQGAPCEPLKRLVADEPLDPLPALEGVPRPRPPSTEPRRELLPEREDTATQIEGFEGMIMRRHEGDSTAPVSPPPAPGTSPPATPAPRLVLLVALAVAVVAWVLQAAW
ncbi:MAG: hypothetical protein V4850_36310 [Myxococcota bacterium]